jgi:small nuclear ribonucleoprotein (snRNP)-like protein
MSTGEGRAFDELREFRKRSLETSTSSSSSSSSRMQYNREQQKVPRMRKLPKEMRTLGVVVTSLMGLNVAVELKNESEIVGLLEESDVFMNMVLVNCKQTTPNGHEMLLDEVHVKGAAVRYVHIAPEINIREHVKGYGRRVSTIGTIYKKSKEKLDAGVVRKKE